MTARETTSRLTRWATNPAVLGWVIPAIAVISTAAVAISGSTAVDQRRAEQRSIARDEAAAAKVEAVSDALCTFYAFQVGTASDPPPDTKRGASNIRKARERYQELGCRPALPAAPQSR